jgi:hypothetical protein
MGYSFNNPPEPPKQGDKKALNSYRVTIYDDERRDPNLPWKVVFESVKYAEQDQARLYGENMAEIIYGRRGALSVHVEYIREGRKPKPVVEPLADPDRELLQAVRADEWFIMGGIRARIETVARDVESARKSVSDLDENDYRTRSLKGMVWECERIIKEYTEAETRLRAAGMKR